MHFFYKKFSIALVTLFFNRYSGQHVLNVGRIVNMNSYQLITALAFALYLGLMLTIGFFHV